MAKIRYIKVEEARYPGEFLVSEANGNRSRETALVSGPAKFEPGTFLTAGTAGHVKAYNPDTLIAPATPDAAVGIAWEGVDLAAGETVEIALIARDAEINKRLVDFADVDPTPSTNQYTAIFAALKALGIIAR
jgi:hypothetical protein